MSQDAPGLIDQSQSTVHAWDIRAEVSKGRGEPGHRLVPMLGQDAGVDKLTYTIAPDTWCTLYVKGSGDSYIIHDSYIMTL